MSDAEREVAYDILIPATLIVNTNDPAWDQETPCEIATYLAAEFVVPTFSDSDVAFPDLCEILPRGPVVIVGESPEEGPLEELDRFIDWLYEEAPPRMQAIEAPRERLLREFRDYQRRRQPGRSRNEPTLETLSLLGEVPHPPTIAYLQEVAAKAEADAEQAAEDATPFDREGFFGIDGDEWEGKAIAADAIQQKNA